jgi:hypothetical protein
MKKRRRKKRRKEKKNKEKKITPEKIFVAQIVETYLPAEPRLNFVSPPY